jgi:hypothetical protein
MTAVVPHTSYAAKSSTTTPRVIMISPIPRTPVRMREPIVGRVSSEYTLL